MQIISFGHHNDEEDFEIDQVPSPSFYLSKKRSCILNNHLPSESTLDQATIPQTMLAFNNTQDSIVHQEGSLFSGFSLIEQNCNYQPIHEEDIPHNNSTKQSKVFYDYSGEDCKRTTAYKISSCQKITNTPEASNNIFTEAEDYTHFKKTDGENDSQDIIGTSKKTFSESNQDCECPLDDSLSSKMPFKIGKRIRTFFQVPGQKTFTSKRQDVILKAVLRAIRRYYLTQFNETTRYIIIKRHRQPEFYLEQLEIFVDILIKRHTQKITIEHFTNIKDKMIIFLGSIFYRKQLILLNKDNKSMISMIQNIHDGLYNYSNSMLLTLYKESIALRFLIELSKPKKEQILSLIATKKRDQKDYQSGFDLIQELNQNMF